MRHVVMLAVSILFGALIAVVVAWALVLDHPLSRHGTLFVAAESRSGAIRQFVLVDRASGQGVEAVAFTGSQALGWVDRGLAVIEETPAPPAWAPWPAEADLTLDQTRLHVAAGWPMACVTADCVEMEERWSLTAEQIGARNASRIPAQRLARLPPEARRRLNAMRPPLSAARRPFATAVPQWHHALVIEDQQAGGPFTAAVLPYRPLPAGLAVNALVYSLPVVVLFMIVRAGRWWLRRLRGRCPRCAYRLRGTMVEGCPECGWGRVPSAA